VHRLAGDDPAGELLAFIEVLNMLFNDPDFHGCMFTNAAAEFPNPHDPVHKAAAAYKQRARNGWRDLARAGGAGAAEAEVFADCYAALIEGALVLRQTLGRNDAARAIRPAVEQLIRSYLKRPPKLTRAARKPPILLADAGAAVDDGGTPTS
jgi:hypothetical protein